MNDIQKKIIDVAKSYLDIKEIGANNSNFNDKEFETNLEAVGWDHGQAWCAYFAELVWREAYSTFDTTVANHIGSIFSSSAVNTMRNFIAAKDFTISGIPKEGAVVIWQHYKDGKPTWMGHAGIVISFDQREIHTIEGNTNKAGDREGQGVEEKVRNRSTVVSDNTTGLVLEGYIWPIEV